MFLDTGCGRKTPAMFKSALIFHCYYKYDSVPGLIRGRVNRWDSELGLFSPWILYFPIKLCETCRYDFVTFPQSCFVTTLYSSLYFPHSFHLYLLHFITSLSALYSKQTCNFSRYFSKCIFGESLIVSSFCISWSIGIIKTDLNLKGLHNTGFSLDASV